MAAAAALLMLAALASEAQGQQSAHQAELTADFAAAEKAYEEELQTRPSAETWQRLGLTRHLQNKFETAIPAFRESLRLNTSLWTSRLFLGICLYRLNQFGTARAELVKAERQAQPNDPGRNEVEYWLGATLIALKQPLAGLMWIERLLAHAPDRLDALQLAVQAYADLGSGLWNEVAERSYETAAGYEVHGHALEAEGNIAGALDSYRHSQALAPRRTGPGTSIGRLLLQEGKPGEARPVLDRELRLNPLDPEASYYTGLAAVQLGDMPAAAHLIEIAVRWAQHDPEPAIALAQVCLALGQRDRALLAVRRALELAPKSTAARDLLQSVEQSR
jgi:tetratricopeptide (TPR) repeat protein